MYEQLLPKTYTGDELPQQLNGRNNDWPAQFGCMPRYYRHIRQDERLIKDLEGIELPDLDAARGEAVNGVRDCLAEAIRKGQDDWLGDAIVIVDDTGRELMTIPFIEALPPHLYKAMQDMLSQVRPRGEWHHV